MPLLFFLQNANMDLKKLALPEHIPLLRRNRVVSGLGIWMGTSLVLLSLLFLTNNSLKDRLVGPFFQGFNGVRTVNSSWPFSFPGSYSSVSNKGGEDNVVSVVLGKTHFSDKGKYGNFSGEEGFGVVYNKSQFSEKGENGSLSGKVFGVKFNASQTGNFSSNNGSSSGGEGFFGSNSRIPVTGNVNVSTGDVNNNTIAEKEVNDVKLMKNESAGGSRNGEEKRVDRNGASFQECDIFDGNWVRDDSKPYYPAGSCPHIGRDFNCHVNGRPDSEFVKWKWQPNGCDIPSLNATDFLERLRGQKLVFVGDSLNRNMWESLVCILRHSIKNKKRVFEISGRTEFKKKGFYAFMFKGYNCTVDFVASPFLVRESSFKGSNGTIETLRLDLMDKTTSMYHDADIIVFNTGHWWTHEKTSRGENYYQEGNRVYPRLKAMDAYKRALLTWARWVDKNIDFNRTQVFFRGYSVTHFRGGQWNSGGQCHRETEPIFNPAYLSKYPGKMKVFQNILQEMHTPVTYLNISRLTDYRKDGHPSIYRMKYKTEKERSAAEHAQDCSHWCLPGVPDTWNELLYASLLKVGRGSWRR